MAGLAVMSCKGSYWVVHSCPVFAEIWGSSRTYDFWSVKLFPSPFCSSFLQALQNMRTFASGLERLLNHMFAKKTMKTISWVDFNLRYNYEKLDAKDMLRVPFTRLSLLFDIIHPELCFLPVPWLCCIVYVSPLHSQEPQLKISIFTACSSWWHYKCLSKPTRTYQGLPGPTVLIKSVAFVPGAL